MGQLLQPGRPLSHFGLKPNSIIQVMFKMSANISSTDELFAKQDQVEEEEEEEEEDEEEEGLFTGLFEEEFSFRAPDIGDRVICAFDQFQYFPAVVKATITDKMQYEVKWEDGTKDNLIHRFVLL